MPWRSCYGNAVAAIAVLEKTPMPCTEMLELEANYHRYNDLSLITTTLLSSGRGEFSKWHRAGRARLAWTIQMHRQNCSACRCEG
jgi:hypothetical protein